MRVSILFAFAFSILASLGLVVVYLLGGQPQVEGALIGVSLGGLGYGMVAWAHAALAHHSDVEERGTTASTVEERRDFARDFERQGDMGRRRLLTTLLGGAVGALAVAAAFPIRSLGPSPGRAHLETAWRPGLRLVTADGDPIGPQTLPVGGAITAFPEGAEHEGDNVLILVRVSPDLLDLPDGRGTWTVQGNVAYSKICTHAGCPVGLFDRQTGLLTCPCHQSAFQTLTGGQPVAGPAARALPQLPLDVDEEGYLVALDEFPGPVGPGFTGILQG